MIPPRAQVLVAQALLPVRLSPSHGLLRAQFAALAPGGLLDFLTWRLFGSLPRNALAGVSNLRSNPVRRFLAAERLLDRVQTGPRSLADPQIAGLVEKTLRRGEQLNQYELQAWVVMPNHVHVLLAPRSPLESITRGIKGVTGREANAILGRIGKPFWQDESFDRWVRNPAEFERVRSYIQNNPVRAGLARRPEDWRWSSAGKRGAGA